MTDKEKLEAIRAEIHRLVDVRGYDREMANDLFTFMDSLPNEPVSEDLEEAIGQSFIYHENRGDDFRSDEQIKTTYRYGFESGAEWKKQQMMANAIDGYAIEDIEEGNGDFLLSAEYLPKSMGLKDQQKVKVIIIKED